MLTFFGTLLASPAHGQPVRVRLTLELDPALEMGPRVTTVVPIRRVGPQKRYVAAGGSFARTLGATYWRRPYLYWSDGTYEGPTILGEAVKIADAPAVEPRRPAPPSPRERLAAALASEGYREVIEALAPAIEGADPFASPEPEETTAYILALEGAGRTGEAARLLVERLERVADENLSGVMGLSRDARLSGPGETRRLQRLAARYLERTEDPRAGVLLASYLWASGRFETARDLVVEAREGGLDPRLADRLLAALDAAAP